MYEEIYNGPDTVDFYCDECEDDRTGAVDDFDGGFVGVECPNCGEHVYTEGT